MGIDCKKLRNDTGSSNSFIILMALSNVKEPLNTIQRDKYTKSPTLKDALEHRLKHEDYVECIDTKNKSLYAIAKRKKVAEMLDCFSICLFIKILQLS
jgi:hypothetical protein